MSTEDSWYWYWACPNQPWIGVIVNNDEPWGLWWVVDKDKTTEFDTTWYHPLPLRRDRYIAGCWRFPRLAPLADWVLHKTHMVKNREHEQQHPLGVVPRSLLSDNAQCRRPLTATSPCRGQYNGATGQRTVRYTYPIHRLNKPANLGIDQSLSTSSTPFFLPPLRSTYCHGLQFNQFDQFDLQFAIGHRVRH